MAGDQVRILRVLHTARQDGSVSDFYVIDDTDLAGAIPYLGKG